MMPRPRWLPLSAETGVIGSVQFGPRWMFWPLQSGRNNRIDRLHFGFSAVKRTWMTPRPAKNNLYLNVLAQPSDDMFSRINQVLLKHAKSADLRRLDRSKSTLQATYLIACHGDETLGALMDDLCAQIPDGEFSFVEQDNTLGG